MHKLHDDSGSYYVGLSAKHNHELDNDPKVVKVMGLLGELGWLSDTGFGNTTIYYEEGSFTHVSFKTTLKGPREIE